MPVANKWAGEGRAGQIHEKQEIARRSITRQRADLLVRDNHAAPLARRLIAGGPQGGRGPGSIDGGDHSRRHAHAALRLDSRVAVLHTVLHAHS